MEILRIYDVNLIDNVKDYDISSFIPSKNWQGFMPSLTADNLNTQNSAFIFAEDKNSGGKSDLTSLGDMCAIRISEPDFDGSYMPGNFKGIDIYNIINVLDFPIPQSVVNEAKNKAIADNGDDVLFMEYIKCDAADIANGNIAYSVNFEEARHPEGATAICHTPFVFNEVAKVKYDIVGISNMIISQTPIEITLEKEITLYADSIEFDLIEKNADFKASEYAPHTSFNKTSQLWELDYLSHSNERYVIAKSRDKTHTLNAENYNLFSIAGATDIVVKEYNAGGISIENQERLTKFSDALHMYKVVDVDSERVNVSDYALDNYPEFMARNKDLKDTESIIELGIASEQINTVEMHDAYMLNDEANDRLDVMEMTVYLDENESAGIVLMGDGNLRQEINRLTTFFGG